MRTMAAVAMFLFGSTFLWMTAAFSGKAIPPTGAAWTVTNVLAMAAVLGFTVAAWGLYREHDWWASAALASAVVGLVAAMAFLVGMRQGDLQLADLGVQINLWMHVLGSAAVIALVRVQVLNEWFTGRLA